MILCVNCPNKAAAFISYTKRNRSIYAYLCIRCAKWTRDMNMPNILGLIPPHTLPPLELIV